MNLYLSILLMSLLPSWSQQHRIVVAAASTGNEDDHKTMTEKSANANDDGEELTATRPVTMADSEDHLKPTLELYEMDANEFYRQINATLFAVRNGLNFTYANGSYDFGEEAFCPSTQNQVMILFTMFLYALVCIVGLFGNTLVIYVVLRFSKMQTVTNIYILNLAIADECFLIGIPLLLYTMKNGFQFGEYACKAYMVSTSITQFTSSIFLLIMSADRYIAVCHPISSPRYRTPTVSKVVSGIAWLTSALLMLPVILFASTVNAGEHSSCNIKWPEDQNTQSGNTFILYSLTLGFATPLTFILGFYCLVIRKLHTVGPKHKSKEKKRSHRKVTKLVLTVITVYIMCWLPYWICQVALIFTSPDKCVSRLELTIFLLSGCLVYSNSAMNPILYAFLSDNFKKSFLKACTCAARKDVNAQLQMENSMFPRFNKSRTAEKLLTPQKAKQGGGSFLGKNARQRTTTTSTTATTTTTTGNTNVNVLETNSSVALSIPQHNNHFLGPSTTTTAPKASSYNSNLLMPPASSVCTENSNVDNISECSDAESTVSARPPVLHTDL
ncbi:allatostatin C receptor 2 [Haematobia irritans]|uniref:allatostatin C receptor 2 n=1 Tax=Haematobia irritans TaxID=7368 RepID=UPI003F50574C